MRKLLILLVIPVCIWGCKKTDAAQQAKIDQQIIQAYIDSNHLTAAVAEPNGLYYVPILNGYGAHPTASSTVTVNYKGYLTNGTVFDQSTNNGVSTPLTFTVGEVIAGWQQGIPLMQKNGRALLLIPSALGYGTAAQSGIPANSVLIFDITLVNIQ